MTTPSRAVACLARFPAVVALTAALILLSALTPEGSSGYLLLAAAAAAALVVVTSSDPATWTVRRVLARASGASGHADAPTAYWCAVPVPHRPQRPRAPGRH